MIAETFKDMGFMKHERLSNIKVLIFLIVCLFLCAALTNNVRAESASEKASYLPVYRVVLEIESIAARLPVGARLIKAEITSKSVKFEGLAGGSEQATMLERLFYIENSDTSISPYTITPLPNLASGFQLSAPVNRGTFLPGDTSTTVTGRNEAYSIPILAYSLQEGIFLEIFKHSQIGLPESRLDRFDFAFTTSYQTLINWLVRAPMLSKALIENLTLVKKNVSLVSVSGTVYLGDLIKDSKQSEVERIQFLTVMRQSTRMSLGKKNPFDEHGLTQREREPLEQFKLAELFVVAILKNGQGKVALVRSSSNGLMFQLRIGNHMGDQEGRIISMTDKDIVLLEMVKDEQGSARERLTTLTVLNK